MQVCYREQRLPLAGAVRYGTCRHRDNNHEAFFLIDLRGNSRHILKVAEWISVFDGIPATVEGLYCKRPIQCLASSELLTPHPPHRPASVSPPHSVRGEDTLAGWRGGGGSIVRKTPRRHCSVLYICKYFVAAAWQQLFQANNLVFPGEGAAEGFPYKSHLLWQISQSTLRQFDTQPAYSTFSGLGFENSNRVPSLQYLHTKSLEQEKDSSKCKCCIDIV